MSRLAGLRKRERRGPIAYMARNGVAANLLMAFVLLAGFYSLSTLPQEFIPEVSLDRVSISVSYPGATPAEVEESIIVRIERAIEGIDGLQQIRATAAEGRGLLVAEIERGQSMQRFLDDVKA